MEKLSDNQIKEQLTSFEGWEYNDNGIEKSFQFDNFKAAFAAMTHIAFEAETADHHPEWSNVYNRLKIRLSTHDAGGVTDKDFDLASKIETIILTTH